MAALLLFAACQQPTNNKQTPADTAKATEQPTIKSSAAVNAKTVNDSLAASIGHYLSRQFLSDADLRTILLEQRTFQLQQTDLNQDGKQETFVFLNSNYFCGTGGCTILLLNDAFKLITKFTVIDPPLYVAPTPTDGWRTITVKSGNAYVALMANNGSYPSNPSVQKQAGFDTPPADYEKILPKDNPKTYTF